MTLAVVGFSKLLLVNLGYLPTAMMHSIPAEEGLDLAEKRHKRDTIRITKHKYEIPSGNVISLKIWLIIII